MKVITRQLGSSGQRLLRVPAGTTLSLGTAPTKAELETELPQTITLTALASINAIAQSLFNIGPIGVALQRVFGQWITVLESIIVPDGPTWHLIEGPIELPFTPYTTLTDLDEDQAVLGLGRARL